VSLTPRDPSPQPPKLVSILNQVRAKVSKDQNTTVLVGSEPLDVKMRVFVSNSVEAKAVSDYIAEHPQQVLSP
jgi:hypothetical protein